MIKKYIIDTSAILSGKLNISSSDYIFADSVINEIKKGSLEKILDAADMDVRSPREKYVEIASIAAKKTGDYSVLSKTDIDVLALAMEYNGIIVTDDYAIQNVARQSGIEYTGSGIEPIMKSIVWKYRCTGCHRIYDKYIEVCPVCGHSVKRYSRK